MRLFDTHAHLDSEEFADQLPQVVQRAKAAGVEAILLIGTTAASSQRCVEIAQQFDGLYAAVGIQPNHVAEAEPGDWERIVALVNQPKVVALGETGLDRYWDRAPFDLQQEYFDRHLRLSQQTGLPFIVHMRECGPDIATMLLEAHARGPLQGVMHSFTGDWPLAQQCLEFGLYISFAGMVTYKKSDDLRAVAAQVPADRLLIETDSPYLSPHPMRSVRPNEPSRIVHTAHCLADVRNLSVEQLAEQTWANAHKFLRLDA